MKKIKNRSLISLFIALAVIAGLVLFCWKFVTVGGKWAGYEGNAGLYKGGILKSCKITDRGGTVLAQSQDGKNSYSDNADVRISTLHTIGDFEGNIGTGALSQFTSELSGWSAVNGTDYDGSELNLSISSALNAKAYELLSGRNGAVIMENYKTGEILCMVSAPSFDPVVGFDQNDPAYNGAYINRCISASFTPGSVFKIVTLSAALENINDIYERQFFCNGYYETAGNKVKCSGVHGYQDIAHAFANSCNCAFAELSLELGSKTIESYAKKYGLLTELSLDGIPVAKGSFTGSGKDAGTAWAGIGQAEDLVTPYGMMRLCAAIANGGEVIEPTLLLNGSSHSTRLMSEETASTIKSLMRSNVQTSYSGVNFAPFQVCAKTGTAETGWGTSHSWFTGFTLDEDCPLAFAVIIENGGSGLGGAGVLVASLLQSVKDALAVTISADK